MAGGPLAAGHDSGDAASSCNNRFVCPKVRLFKVVSTMTTPVATIQMRKEQLDHLVLMMLMRVVCTQRRPGLAGGGGQRENLPGTVSKHSHSPSWPQWLTVQSCVLNLTRFHT